MVTAEELTVAIRSEGVSETQQDLEGVEDSMSNTANTAGDAADNLEGFSQRFQGAMTAAVGALAVAAAGLLSQVPVVGEVGSALGAILDSLILKIDDDLRPTLGGLRNDLFGVAQDVHEAGSALEGLRIAVEGVRQSVSDAQVSVLQREIESLTGITIPENWLDFGFDLFTLQASQTFSNIETIIRQFPEDVGILLGSINPRMRQVWNQSLQDARQFVTDLVNAFTSFPSRARGVFSDVASELSSWASDLASDAYGWGENVIERFVSGIRSIIGRVRQWLSDLRGIGANIGVDVPSLGDIGGSITGGGGGGGSGPLFGNRSSGVGSQIDGRQLTESTGRYRSDPSRRRGI